MQPHQGRHSLAVEMTGSARRHNRRHSSSDVLLKVLQRRRSSAVETLSSSFNRVMVAISVNQPQPPAERKNRRCNRTEDITSDLMTSAARKVLSNCCFLCFFPSIQREGPYSKVHQDGGDPEARDPGSHAVLHGLRRESL